jgi:predicted neuraminidase
MHWSGGFASAFILLATMCLETACAQAPGEFVADPAPTPSSHASTLVELKDGSILAAWFGGSEEGARDVAIWAARRQGDHWQKPFVLARETNIATYNPVLFHSADGVLWLYYKFGPGPTAWSAARRSSHDEGSTWSEVEYLPAGLLGPIRAKPLVLDDGTIVAGSSVESYRTWAVWIERSTDQGKSWTEFGPITVPGLVHATDEGRHGIIQPSVVPLDERGQRLRIFVRATKDIGRICAADSLDAGLTWTPASPTELPNPNSGIDALRLADGRFVMVYNDSTWLRTPLVLAVSKDATHWRNFLTLENAPGEFSYPALIQAKSGALLMTYTWDRKRIRFVKVDLAQVP